MAVLTQVETTLAAIRPPDLLRDLSTTPEAPACGRAGDAVPAAVEPRRRRAPVAVPAAAPTRSDHGESLALDRTRVLLCAVCHSSPCSPPRRVPRRWPISRGCCAGRDRSCGSAPATRRGCRSCCPTRPGRPPSRAACAATGITVTAVRTESGATALRTAFRCDLVELARAWTRGAMKTVPGGMAAGRSGVADVGAGCGPARRAGRLPPDARSARTRRPTSRWWPRAPERASRRPGWAGSLPCGSAAPAASSGSSSSSARSRRGRPRRTGRDTGVVTRLDGLVRLARRNSAERSRSPVYRPECDKHNTRGGRAKLGNR